MDKIILGFDNNLGFPEEFCKRINLKTTSYENLTSMLDDFERNQLSLIFTPAGTLPYIKSEYAIIAQATLGSSHSHSLTSKLVIRQNLTQLDIASAHLGRVNQYCTTSFWAPLIYLMKSAEKTHSVNFINTQSFQDMLFKVADQKIDGAMVWDVILQANPNAAEKVQLLGEINTLPAPIILAKSTIPDSLKNTLSNVTFDDRNTFFNGFISPDTALINHFKEEMFAAARYFHLANI